MVMKMNAEIQEKLQLLPDKPGVYLMKNADKRIIYVGKAINLKNRVRSYFQSSKNHSPKVRAMVEKIATFEYIITTSEIEALILECNLIKRHRPRYNISLKDDKTYPYIKVTMAEAYPRVHITRRVMKDGGRYFGPYTSAGAVHETLRLLKKLFPIRSCKRMDSPRPCLEHHIKRCLAPCTGNVPMETYRRMIDDICLFLEGRSDQVVRSLEAKMAEAADDFRFEEAARLRDQLVAVKKVQEKQNIVTGSGDQDVIGMARLPKNVCVQVFFIRSGKMVGRDHYLLRGSDEEEDSAILTAFLKQYYARAAFIPREILLPFASEETELLTAFLSAKKEAKVMLHVPQRGTKKDIVTMACDNARLVLEEEEKKRLPEQSEDDDVVEELRHHLGLAKPPYRMECFDISHTQGTETVASMVVFEGGRAKKSDYRKFRLRPVEGKPDDFRSMEEVVLRRYRELKEPLPDLIVIDGGKGQLSSALKVIRGVGLTDVPVVGLAKQFEYVFREGESDPVILPRHSQSLYLMQQIRDEAHRFAITYHRNLRAKRNMQSVLDHIVGIGPKRRQALWKAFGSIDAMRSASVEELAQADGMNSAAAQAVYDFFRAHEI